MVTNLQNYYVFADLVKNGTVTIYTKDITPQSWDMYYNGLYNILLDGIEQKDVENLQIHVVFQDNEEVDLSIFDCMMNIIMWQFNVLVDLPINAESLFIGEAITQDTIKDYFDRFIVRIISKIDAKRLNNAIADTLHKFQVMVDSFSLFLANTINIKDFIELGENCKDFYDCLHPSLRNTNIRDVKNEGMKIANKSIDYIINSEKYMGHEHCLKNSFLSKEGTNPKQYKELMIHIGTKPTGTGNVIPSIIDTSYARGMRSVQDQFMDSSASRVAQIQTKDNVGESGDMARILGLNNMDTFINDDLNYRCNTRNFIKITLTNKKVFDRFAYRFYRTNPDGVDQLLTPKDTYRIGQTLYFRSPMTCASHAHDHGICVACYGMLAYINYKIGVGKFATEQLSYQLTQKQLSAKHLLETTVNLPEWENNVLFDKYFVLDINGIFINPTAPNATLIFNLDDIISTEDTDEYKTGAGDYNSYVVRFNLRDKSGEYPIQAKDNNEMYITEDFMQYLNKNGKYDEDTNTIEVQTKDIVSKEICMFLVMLENDELSKTLKEIDHCINLRSSVNSHTKDSLVQTLIQLCIDGGITIQAVHIETILSNQIRAINSSIRKPEWEYEDVPYRIITLDKALKDNPSIAVSLMYKDPAYMLSTPLSFKKTAPSIIDPFFMTQPQLFMTADDAVVDPNFKHIINPFIKMPKEEK